MKFNDYRIIPAEKPKQIVVLLHGVGADGKDLLDLGHRWQSKLPACVFVSPDAPHRYDMAPFGFQWFSLKDRTPEVMAADMIQCRPLVNEYIDQLLAEFSLPDNKLALVGFSQGTMVALDVAPRRAQQIAGVIGYSGSLLSRKTLHNQIKSRMPVSLIHGMQDDVVSVDFAKHAEELLKAEGVPCELHLQPNLGHGIDDSGINIGEAFLQRIFA